MKKSQLQIFYEECRKIGEANELFCQMVRNGDITRRDLARLMERRPNVWGRFAGFLNTLPE